jgi:uncharacterized membrane protein
MLAGYFVAALAGTWINFLDFHLNGIGYYDLSINQQALSSTIHSNQPYPFYEATNCGRNGRCSFLLVHPVFLAYLVAVPYALWPSAFTLFAIQDLALALAALPLFAIARLVTQSNRLSIVIAGIYLVWLPAFSGIFSFHWEAFIPLEFFLVFWLWLTHRYRWAIPVVFVAFITLEIAPVLIFLLGAYFLLDWFPSAARYLWTALQRLATRVRGDTSRKTSAASSSPGWKELLRPPVVRASLALMLVSVAAYVVLHEFATTGGPLLGLPALPPRYAVPLAQPDYATSVTFGDFNSAWQAKLLFWLVIYATLAMVPLLAPRTLVLSVPWIFFSLIATPGYYRMGDQYAFVTAAVVFIGFVYGIARIKRWASAVAQPTSAASRDTTTHSRTVNTVATPSIRIDAPKALTPDVRRSLRRRVSHVSLTILLVGVLAFNLFMNPLNPLAAPLKVDAPFEQQSALGLSGGLKTTDYDRVLNVVSMIPDRAIVAVSPILFTFVANDPYAYPLETGMNLSLLPFNTTDGTQYVLYSSHGGTVPSALAVEIYNISIFGVRAWVPTTAIGDVWLIQRGYTGPTQIFGTVALGTGGNYTANNGLLPGAAGIVGASSTSPSGTVIKGATNPTNASRRVLGRVFSGPGVSLTAGAYEVTVNLSGTQVDPPEDLAGNTTVATLQLTGEWAGLHTETVNVTVLSLSQFGSDSWTSVEFNLELACPLLSLDVIGTNHAYWFELEVSYVLITPVIPL